MELFYITCTTCHRRLRVCDESAIGQILSCPGCQGMVQIIAPPDWRPGMKLTAAGASSAMPSSPSATPISPSATPSAGIHLSPSSWSKTPLDSTFDAAASLLGDEPVQATTKQPSADASFPRAQPEKTVKAVAAPHARKLPATPAPVPAAEDVGATVEDLTLYRGAGTTSKVAAEKPSEPRDSGTARRWRDPPPDAKPVVAATAVAAGAAPQLGAAGEADTPLPKAAIARRALPATWRLPLVISAGLLGVVLAVGIFVWSVSGSDGKDGGSSQANSGRPTSGPSISGTTDGKAPVTPSPKTKTPDDEKDGARENTENEEPASPSETPATAPPTNEFPSETTPTAPAPDGLPPDLAIEGDEPPDVASGGAGGADGEEVASGPSPLEAFAPFLDGESSAEDSDAETTDADAASDETTGAPAADEGDASSGGDSFSSDPAVARPKPREVDVAARLADRLPSIEVASAPLDEFLRFTSDFSTIPITIEPWALAAAKIDSHAPVSLKLEKAAVAEWLTAALAPLGLAYEIRGDKIAIVRPPVGELKETTYDVADLTSGEAAKVAFLVELIPALVSPGAWGEAGGAVRAEGDSLVVKQSPRIAFETLTFLEKLRVARGLPTRSEYGERAASLEAPAKQAAAALATPISLNYLRPERLVEIVTRLDRLSGMQILIDWQSLESEGWNPEGEAILSVAGAPLSSALDSMLAPMGLAWTVYDGKTIQIVSAADRQAKIELAFFKLPAGGNSSELLSRAKAALGEDAAIRLDAESGYLLAALSAPRHEALAKIAAK